MRRLFGCPDIVSLTEKFLMARNFFRIFTENNPVMGYSKTFFIPEAKGLRSNIWTPWFLFPDLFTSCFDGSMLPLFIILDFYFKFQACLLSSWSTSSAVYMVPAHISLQVSVIRSLLPPWSVKCIIPVHRFGTFMMYWSTDWCARS